jgi:hypothetical protein
VRCDSVPHVMERLAIIIGLRRARHGALKAKVRSVAARGGECSARQYEDARQSLRAAAHSCTDAAQRCSIRGQREPEVIPGGRLSYRRCSVARRAHAGSWTRAFRASVPVVGENLFDTYTDLLFVNDEASCAAAGGRCASLVSTLSDDAQC